MGTNCKGNCAKRGRFWVDFWGRGYYFVHLLEPEADSVAELSAEVQIIAAAVVSLLPAVGVYFGCLSARKKREKEVSELHHEGELRQKRP